MTSTTTGARVRVLSYNLNLLPRGCGGFQRERLQTFLEAVDAYDVLLLQEVYATSVLPYAMQPLFCYQAALLASLHEKGFAHHVVARQPSYWTVLKHGITCDSGLVIASRYPIARSGSYTFRTHATIKQAAPKGCLVAEVLVPCAQQQQQHDSVDEGDGAEAPCVPVLFFNVHMRPEEAVTAADSSQVQQMRIFVETLLQHTQRGGGDGTAARVPFVVAGDFNIQGIDATTNAPTRQYSEFVTEMQLLGDVRDVLYEACGRHPPTRPSHLFFPAQSTLTQYGALSRRQDYLLVNSAAVAAADTRVEKFVVGHYRPYAYLSDHFGIATTLRVCAAAATTTSSSGVSSSGSSSSSGNKQGGDDGSSSAAATAAAAVVVTRRRAGAALLSSRPYPHHRHAQKQQQTQQGAAPAMRASHMMPGLLAALVCIALTVSVTPLVLFAVVWCVLQWRWLLLQRTPVRRRFARVTDAVVRGRAEVDLLPLDGDDDDEDDEDGDSSAAADDKDAGDSMQQQQLQSQTCATPAGVKDDGVGGEACAHSGSSGNGSSGNSSHNEDELLRILPGVDSLATAWERAVRRHRTLPCLGAVGDVGDAEWQSYGTVDARARDVGAALLQHLGVQPGEAVAVVCDACRNAVVVELACMLVSVATLPLAGKSSTMRALLDSHRVRVAFADRAALASLLLCRSTALETVVCLQPVVDEDDAAAAKDLNIALLTLDALEHRGRASATTATATATAPPPRPSAQTALTRTMDNTATVDVTHGVVVWTHGDVLREVRVLQRTGVLPRGPWHESMLWCTPFAVLFHRICVLGLLLQGNAVAAARATNLQAALRTFHPTLLVLSPLQFATSRLQLRRAQRQHTLYSALFDRVFALRARLLQLGNTDCPLLRYLFFRRFARQLGGSVRTVVLSVSQVSTPYPLREHIAVCYTPHVREVSFCSGVGVCTIDGVPAPTLRVSLRPTMGPLAHDANIGQLALTRYGAHDAVHDAARGGVVHVLATAARWEANRTLTLLGPPLGVLWPRGAVAQCAIADDVEHTLAKSRYVHDVFVHCEVDKPLIAVVCPNRDTVEYEWRHRTRDASGAAAAATTAAGAAAATAAAAAAAAAPSQLVWSELVTFATPLILADLRALCVEEGLPASHTPQFVHVYPHAFRSHRTFVTPFGKLRREHVCRYFSAVFEQLYRGMSKTAATAGDNAHAAAAAALTANTALRIVAAASGGEHSGSVDTMPPLDSDADNYNNGNNNNSSSGSGSFAASPWSPRTPRDGGGELPRLQVPVAIDIGGTFCKFAYIVPPHNGGSAGDGADTSSSLSQLEQQQEATVAPDVDAQQPHVALEHEASSLSERIGLRALHFLRDTAAAERELRGCAASPVGTLRFGKIPTMQLPRLASVLAARHALDAYAPAFAQCVRATGGGAFKYAALARRTLGVDFDVVKEMDAVVRGLNLVLSIAPDSVFTVDGDTGKHLPHRLYSADGHFAPFPYLLINIGSGISFIHCTSADGAYVRVGGTPIGGATFWGLTRLLTHLTSWDEVKAIMRLDGPGDNTNVDLLVGDIYGFNARNLPAMLSPESVASCFGKYGTERFRGAAPRGSPVEHFADDGMGEIAASSSSRRRGGAATTATTMMMAAEAALSRSSAGVTGGHGATTRRSSNHASDDDDNNSSHDNSNGNDDDDVGDESSDDSEDEVAHMLGGGFARHRRRSGGAAGNNNNNKGNNAAASAFASSHPQHTTGDASHAGSSMDVVRSLLNMIAGNVTQLAYLHSRVHNVPHIIFAGGFVRNNAIVWSTISKTLAYWSNGACHAHFLEHDGYLGALGCAVTVSEAASATAPASTSKAS